MDLTPVGRFAYEPEGSEIFCLNSAYFMHGKSIKMLAAFLNSNLISWYVSKMGVTSGLGVPRWIKETIDEIPVPMGLSNEFEFRELVSDRLVLNANMNEGKVHEIECAIEEKVRSAYGITDREYNSVIRSATV